MRAPSCSVPTDASGPAHEIRNMRAVVADGPFELDCVFDLVCEGEATP